MNSIKSKLRFFLSHDLKLPYIILASLTGFFIGIILSYNSPLAFGSLDYIAFFAKPSVSCLLFINLMPVILAYIFLRLSMHQLFYPLIFLDGLYSGCCRMGLLYLFGNSSWLMYFFLMFSHSIATVFSWLLLFCNAMERRNDLQKKFYLYSILISVITILDVCLIAPVLSEVNYIL